MSYLDLDEEESTDYSPALLAALCVLWLLGLTLLILGAAALVHALLPVLQELTGGG